MSELLNVTDIKEGLPGISKSSCAHYYEAFMVCMHRCQHKIGTELGLSGDAENAFSLHWVDYFDDVVVVVAGLYDPKHDLMLLDMLNCAF